MTTTTITITFEDASLAEAEEIRSNIEELLALRHDDLAVEVEMDHEGED